MRQAIWGRVLSKAVNACTTNQFKLALLAAEAPRNSSTKLASRPVHRRGIVGIFEENSWFNSVERVKLSEET